jgi:hypothetical protein
MIGRSESQRYFSSTCATCFSFSFPIRNLRHSNHRIGAHTCTNQTVPYGTALLGGAVPGTSCQATIAPSLRDAFSPAPLGHNPKSLSAFVERTDLFDPSRLSPWYNDESCEQWAESAANLTSNLEDSLGQALPIAGSVSGHARCFRVVD